MAEDTIAAIATPVGSGGIGIIKISGHQALSIAAALFRPFRKHTGFFPESHQLYYGHIVNDEQILDEVLLAVMKAPHSYTGEDVVEIQAHAGTFLLKSILESVLKQGARLAHPGEFTKRAFLNGRIDLTQAEAVMDLICAKSTRSLDIAAAQLRGGIREEIEAIRQSLLSVLSAIEAGIDFPEDMGDDISAEQTIAQLNAAVFRIREMISRYRDGHVLKEGLKVLVIGRPNVGKSSLMNRLLGRDRVIVTPIPGTTRDLIEESLTIQGIPIILADSAGLHEGGDLAEQIGMEKTCQYIDEADLILFMLDASALMTPEDWQIYEKIRDTQMIAVINKSDLTNEIHRPELPHPIVCISALYNKGLDALKEQIAQICLGKATEEHRAIPSLRHKLALERSLESALAAINGLQENIPFELISIDLQESLNAIDEITGQTIGEDMLDQIFAKFCIGK